MGAMAPQTTSLTIVYSTAYSGADQRKHQSSSRLVFVRVIHRWLMNSPHKWPVTRKMFPFDDVIMLIEIGARISNRIHCFLWVVVTHPCPTSISSTYGVITAVRLYTYPDSKVHGANMGPTWGRQDPGGPHVGPMNLAICVCTVCDGGSHSD